MVFLEVKKICWYNSLGGTDRTKLNGILQYLKDEWRAKRGGELDLNCEWELVPCNIDDVPQQENGKCVMHCHHALKATYLLTSKLCCRM